jgi:5-methylcytosine-specific restriction endonuclease McrA
MEALVLFLAIIVAFWFKSLPFQYRRQRRKEDYSEYLKSDAWQRKRFVVLRRDNWTCQYCGVKATEVHHKRYAKNIGREPIKWLVSLCRECHKKQH